MVYSKTNGAGIDCVADEISPLKNRPFVAYYQLIICPELFVFSRIDFCHGNQRQKVRLGLQRQTARATTKNGETRTTLQAALHAREQQAIAAGGIVAVEAIRDIAVKHRDESNARTAK